MDFIYECYRNNIYLLFLPAHSSHVLQPLDISIFSPLKNAYRQHLHSLTTTNDSTLAMKILFLESYSKAREAALSDKNIRGGWKGSGLWPVNLAKPLMNPMVLQPDSELLKITSPLPRSYIQTPKTAIAIREACSQITPILTGQPIARLLFRKIQKGIDDHNVQIAKLEAQIKHQKL
jgi:hypothetical protein